MKFALSTCALLFALVVPASAMTSSNARPFSPIEIAAFRARIDPNLGSLRAGRVVAPAPITVQERAAFAAAQRQHADLGAVRAGSGLSNDQLKWVAIGAGIVLLIILI